MLGRERFWSATHAASSGTTLAPAKAKLRGRGARGAEQEGRSALPGRLVKRGHERDGITLFGTLVPGSSAQADGRYPQSIRGHGTSSIVVSDMGASLRMPQRHSSKKCEGRDV